MVGALSQSVVERWLGASVAQPGRCFSTPESIRLVSGKARLACPAGSRVQTPPEAPKKYRDRRYCHFRVLPEEHMWREGRSLRPPIFQKPFLVWRGFRARQAVPGTVLAVMTMERRRHYRTNFGRVAGALPELRSGLIMGESR